MQEQQVRVGQGSGADLMTSGASGSPAGGRRPLAAYVIVERKGYDKPFWNRIGSAFYNRDGSINILLDAFPVQGKIQLREDTPREGPPKDPPSHEGGAREIRVDSRRKPSDKAVSGDPFAGAE